VKIAVVSSARVGGRDGTRTARAVELSADTAFVGFTGGTGGLFSLQDILNWQYAEQEGNLPPRAPTNLQVVSVVRHERQPRDVTLTWQCNNAYTAQGFSVERSTDGVNYTQIGLAGADGRDLHGPACGPGRALLPRAELHTQGFSRSSNVVTAEINVPAAPINLQIINLFAQHAQIGWDPNSSDQSGFQSQRSTDGHQLHDDRHASDAFTTATSTCALRRPLYYRVEALNGNGVASLPSNVLQIN